MGVKQPARRARSVLAVARDRSAASSANPRRVPARVTRWLAGLGLLLIGLGASARAAGIDHDHGAWTRQLARFVHDGRVDYASWARDGRTELDAYLRTLEAVEPVEYAAWSREQRLAFWIDAYNAYMVRQVLDHYPLASVREIGLLPFAAFKDDVIPLERLRGGKLSLDDVEHRILRKEIGEPLIHFGIVCASKSCPALASEAYRADAVMGQLESAARRFLADPSKNRIDADGRTVRLSSIFQWFREDFERSGTLARFVARYAPQPMAAALERPDVKLEFLDYDWSLNGVE